MNVKCRYIDFRALKCFVNVLCSYWIMTFFFITYSRFSILAHLDILHIISLLITKKKKKNHEQTDEECIS